MSKKWLAVALTLISAFAVAQTAPAAGASAVLDQQLGRVEKDLVPMASEMPEAKFDFAPTNGQFTGVRTFADQIKHVAIGNYRIGAAILGENPPVSREAGADAKTKAQVVKLLTDSLAYAHKALASITDANLTVPIASPFGSGQTTRLGLAVALIADQRDHYGQMVVYFRMNGMVPPASRK